MKKLNFVLISLFIYVFLFIACDQKDISELDTEKSGSETPFELSEGNDNDQGENEGNDTPPPVMDPPIDDMPDNVTVSVCIDYELSHWCNRILVRLTLSEGAWDTMASHVAMSNSISWFAHEWVNLSSDDTNFRLMTINSIKRPISMINGFYYHQADIGSVIVKESIIDQRVLFYRFECSCGWYQNPNSGIRISAEQAAQNLIPHLPITVTINEEKLAEMKKYTNIESNLRIGTKIAVLDKLE
jgi:hypothetical protein